VKAVVQDTPPQAAAGIIEWLSAALNGRSLINEIDDSTTRISELVRNVKEYTYMDQDRVQEVDIHKSLEATLKILGHKLRDIKIEREYDPDLPRITANGSELNQVWTNLIDNASDAVKGIADACVRLITRWESDFVMIAVEDNGRGVPKEALHHLFEPFYTTKGVGEGTGLGLDIAYRIVTQHEGSIEVESVPGCTRFIVRLPVRKQ
jgi:signal transduction histidine kinase